MVKVLVEMGVDPHKEDTLKQTPIFYASREGNANLINYLISLGSEDLNRQDKYGQTAVYYAVREGHIKTVQQLIDLGANFDIVDTKNQRPLYYAIQAGRYEMCKFLVDKGADLQMEDKKGMTPTHWARKHHQVEVLNLLMENGGVNLEASTNKRPAGNNKKVKPADVPVEPKVRENERKIPRRYMLTKLREGGHYSPMTDAEFEEFRRQNPQIAKYFELSDEGEDV